MSSAGLGSALTDQGPAADVVTRRKPQRRGPNEIIGPGWQWCVRRQQREPLRLVRTEATMRPPLRREAPCVVPWTPTQQGDVTDIRVLGKAKQILGNFRSQRFRMRQER